MNSIRPLATITLLACAGLFLYMKINESEPVLPEELGEWSNTLDVDPNLGSDGASDFGGDSYGSIDGFGGAPQASGPSGGSAPGWTPPPAAETPPANDTTPPADNGNLSAAQGLFPTDSQSPEVPEMPDLPPLGGDSDAGAADNASASPPISDQAYQQAPRSDYGAASPAATADTPTAGAGSTSKYETARMAIEAALDRGELVSALRLTTEWYGDPSLTPPQAAEVETLLSQLAGTVIYSTQSRMEPPYIVRAGENLDDIAKKYDVPWQLLAKINGIAQPGALQPGQELKVVKGPFTALVDLSRRELTLMLDRHYAGRFPIEFDPQFTVEEGSWSVDQKLTTPVGAGLSGAAKSAGEDRSLVLSNPSQPGGQVAVLRGPKTADPIAAAPGGRVIRLNSSEVEDVYDILSVGSRVIIRR